MVDAPAKTKKKIAGQTPTMWGVEVAAVVLAYILWKRHQASAAATTAAATTGGSTIPTVVETTGTTSTSPASLAAWIQQVISSATNATYTSSQALTDINDWLSGQCVSSAGYNAIGQAVAQFGVPPGYSTTPALSVCSSSGAGSSSTPAEQGSGFLPTGVASGGATGSGTSTVTDGLGNVFTWLNGTEADQLLKLGQPLYYQPLPGNFVKVTNWAAIAPGTPLYGLSGGPNAAKTNPTTASTPAAA